MHSRVQKLDWPNRPSLEGNRIPQATYRQRRRCRSIADMNTGQSTALGSRRELAAINRDAKD